MIELLRKLYQHGFWCMGIIVGVVYVVILAVVIYKELDE